MGRGEGREKSNRRGPGQRKEKIRERT